MGLSYCCTSKAENQNDSDFKSKNYVEDLENKKPNLGALKERHLHCDNRSEQLDDHSCTKDDVAPLISFDNTDFGRYEIFEHRFPFYRMDVNGFIYHIDTAMVNTCKENTRA